MKCPECYSEQGAYQDIEDWSAYDGYTNYKAWHCHCGNSVYSYESEFVWPDEGDLGGT